MNIISLLLATCLLSSHVAFADSPMENKGQPTSQILLQSTQSWDGTSYRAYPKGQPELSILKITIPANTTLKWHKHPIPNAAYVLSGELKVQAKKGGKSIRLKAGDTLAEMVDIIHRGATGDSPVELVVFYAGAVGTPLSQ
ncbi:cupin domain-containing protein [Pseudomonas sp. NPDC089734]|uniref:cupin domain-containing protein n=1 Tax=Pseudomonas sp. NPDC089734 TaxID=3364469 RepID=UPI003820E9A8